MSDYQDLRKGQGMQQDIKMTQQIDSSIEQLNDYKDFNFVFAGIKKKFIEVSQVLNDSLLPYEARVEKAKRIVQSQLTGHSLFNQNDDDLDEKQTIQGQDNFDNDDPKLIQNTIQTILFKNEQLTLENKNLKEENLSLTNQNIIYKQQREKLKSQNANAQQIMINQIERSNLQITNLQKLLKTQILKNALLQNQNEQIKSQLIEQRQATASSHKNLLLELEQVKSINNSLLAQNSYLKKEKISKQRQSQLVEQIAVKQSNQIAQLNSNQQSTNNFINSLEQQLINFKNKKKSQDNNSFVNKLREIKQVQGQQSRQQIVDDSRKITELEKRIKNLEEDLEENKTKNIELTNQIFKEERKVEQKSKLIQQVTWKFKDQQGHLLNRIQVLDQQIVQKEQIIRRLNNNYYILQEKYSQASKELENLKADFQVTKKTQILPAIERDRLIAQITELRSYNSRLIQEKMNYKGEDPKLNQVYEKSKEQLKKCKNELNSYKNPTKQRVYIYIQEIFKRITKEQKTELKTNLISILSSIV